VRDKSGNWMYIFESFECQLNLLAYPSNFTVVDDVVIGWCRISVRFAGHVNEIANTTDEDDVYQTSTIYTKITKNNTQKILVGIKYYIFYKQMKTTFTKLTSNIMISK